MKSVEITEKNLEEKFRTLAEESPNMIFINQGGRVVYANRMCEEVMGYSREEFYSPGFDFLSLIAPESRDLVVENFQRHMRGEEVPPYEYTLLTKDGRRIIAIHTTKLIEYGGEKAILGIITDITERKQMEDKLRKLSVAVEASMEGIAILNNKGEYIFLNDAHAKIYGYESPKELIGKTWRILYDENELRRFDREIMPRLLKERRYRGEAIGKKKDGSRFFQELSLTVLEDGGFICIVHDITDKKRAEELLKKSEKEYRDLVDNAPIGVYKTTLDGEILYANRSLAEMLGYNSVEDLPRKVEKGCTNSVKWLSLIDQLRKSGRIDMAELELVRKDGKTITALFSATLSGSVLSGMIMDITEKKKLEQEIRDILNAAPDVIHVISPEMKITHKNAMSQRVFPQIKVGDYCYSVKGRNYICDGCGVKKVFEDGRMHEHESIFKLSSGKEVIMHSTSAPVFDDKGEIVAAVEILRDITGRKKAEENLKIAYEELKELDKLKDDFLGTVSHELRTPLTSIIGSLDILKDDCKKILKKDQMELLEIALRESERLDSLISDLLEMVRTENKLTRMAKMKISTNELLESAVEGVRMQANKKKIKLHVSIEKGLPQIIGDIDQLKRAIINLLTNAIKFNKIGGEVVLDARSTGSNLIISVSDTGIGIPKGELDKIFEKFYRVETGTTRLHGGTGLGLAIVKKIIHAHGGEIKVESKLGAGSKFTIILPLEDKK